MNKFEVNLERLRRHYDMSVKTYDYVSFLDLSHALRQWVELKPKLPDLNGSFASSKLFKTASPGKKISVACKGREYVYAAFPGGIITYASKGDILSIDGEPEGDMSLAGRIRIKDGSLEAAVMCIVAKGLAASERRAIEHCSVKRCNYAQWMSSEAMRVGYSKSGELKSLAISREMLIKRVANSLDGSHVSAESADQTREKSNRFDGAVKAAMKYKYGGLPAPYFVLLKIAQDILDVAHRKRFSESNSTLKSQTPDGSA